MNRRSISVTVWSGRRKSDQRRAKVTLLPQGLRFGRHRIFDRATDDKVATQKEAIMEYWMARSGLKTVRKRALQLNYGSF